MQDERSDVRRPGHGNRRDGCLELSVGVGEVREDRGHQHSSSDAGRSERARDVKPAQRWRRARLHEAPEVFVETADGHRRGNVRNVGRPLQQRQIAQDQRTLGEDRERVATSLRARRMSGISR